MPNQSPAIRSTIAAVAGLWALLVLDIILRLSRDWWLAQWLGLRPQDPTRLHGIVTAHLLHADPAHLIGNTVALLILGPLAVAEGPRHAAYACGMAALVSGTLTWCIGEPGTIHVGASGIIFGLIAYCLWNGLLRRGCLPFLISLLVGGLYAGSLSGMVPGMASTGISWQMHLGGFVGGSLASLILSRRKPR